MKKYFLEEFEDENIDLCYLESEEEPEEEDNNSNDDDIVNIQVEEDENNEKVVRLVVQVPVGEDNNITLDLYLNKNIYLSIAQKLLEDD